MLRTISKIELDFRISKFCEVQKFQCACVMFEYIRPTGGFSPAKFKYIAFKLKQLVF